jgi:hypothetical protein
MKVGRALRAPKEDGAVLADPSLESFQKQLTERTWERRLAIDARLGGRPLTDLRKFTRQTALQLAQSYLARAGQEVAVSGGLHILAAGHQPEIVHPGVWVKHFALNGLGTATGLTPLNLIVDNDTVKTTAIPVPSWHDVSIPETYYIEKLAFDTWPGEVPYEEYQVRSHADFDALPRRFADATRDWPFKPVLADYWREVQRRAPNTALLGERLVSGRRALERRWGCLNLELPISHLCETESFASFIGHILNDIERFHRLYNETVREYRRVNGLRSRNHPVPDLATDGEWREVPLWAWRNSAHRRARLFVRPGAEEFELRAEGDQWPCLPRAATQFVEAWQKLHQAGFKIRSRALITTLFARLIVADGFIHGIGGAKYDELTDELIRRFFRVEPPPFLVLSATLLLALRGFAASSEKYRAAGQQIRDLRWNPQRHLSATRLDPKAKSLATQKQALIATLADGQGPIGSARHKELRRLTADLQPFVHSTLDAERSVMQRLEAELKANAILRRRDYPFCLYPETQLRPFLQRFLTAPAGGLSTAAL